MENQTKTVLVTGATGKTGSRVAKKLTDLNIPVRSGSRSANPRFDWEDASTWEDALRGIHSVYITFQPDLAVPGAVETIRSFLETAKGSGVEKVALLSGRGEKEAQDCEQLVIHSGLEWTVVRASWFNQNFSEGYLLDSVLAGYVSLPAGDVREPFIDVDDIADLVVASLTQPGHKNRLYEVTGPRLISFKEAVDEIGAATGRPIQYNQLSLEEYAVQLREYKLPDEYVWLLTYLFSEVLDGRNESVCSGVEEALGRKPKDFSDYVKEVAATGAWGEI